jgi:hypothetical protein
MPKEEEDHKLYALALNLLFTQPLNSAKAFEAAKTAYAHLAASEANPRGWHGCKVCRFEASEHNFPPSEQTLPTWWETHAERNAPAPTATPHSVHDFVDCIAKLITEKGSYFRTHSQPKMPRVRGDSA